MKEKIEQRIVGLFVLIFAIVVYVSYSALHTIQQSVTSIEMLNKTHAALTEVDAVLSSLHAGDAALRTFLMTGDTRDQSQYRLAYSQMLIHLDTAKALVKTGEERTLQEPQLAQLQTMISNRIDFTRSVVMARQSGGLDAATKLLIAHPDVEPMGRLEGLVQNIHDQENSLLITRDRETHLAAQATRTTVYMGVGANLVLLILAIWLMRDDLKARHRTKQVLEEANATLELKVQERTAELVKSNASLKQENLERKWSSQALDHQLRYSQLIINSINELVFVISRALNISRINPAVSHAAGWEPQDLIAQSLDRALPLTTEAAAGCEPQNPISFAMRQGREIHEKEVTLLTKSGQKIQARYSMFPLRDQDKVVGAVVTVRVPPGAH